MIFGRCVAVVERNAKFENGLPGVFLRYCSQLGMFFAVCFWQHKSKSSWTIFTKLGRCVAVLERKVKCENGLPGSYLWCCSGICM